MVGRLGRGRPHVGVTAVLGVLALVACGPAAPDPAPTSELDGMLDLIFGVDADPSHQSAESRRAEELTAECMQAAGFEYHPDELAGTGWSVRPDEYGTLAFAERYGFGQTIETVEGEPPPMWRQPQDGEGQRRNREYVATLSPAAAAEYEVALHGPERDPAEVEEPYVPAGCAALAAEEVFPDGFAGPADLRDVKTAVREMYSKVDSDPRVEDAMVRWGACMEESGYPGMSHPIDAESYVGTDIWADWQDRYVDATGSATGVTDYDVVRTRIPDALVELQSAEIAVAVADATCRDEVGYRQAVEEVESSLEAEILTTYRDDLERWLAWSRERSAE